MTEESKKLVMLVKYGQDDMSFKLIKAIFGTNPFSIEYCNKYTNKGESLLDISIRRKLNKCSELICTHIKSITNEPAQVNFYSIYNNNKKFKLGKDITISKKNLMNVDFKKYFINYDVQKFLAPILTLKEWISLDNVSFIHSHIYINYQDVEELLLISSKTNIEFLLMHYVPTIKFIHYLIKNYKWELLWYIFIKWPAETQEYAICLEPNCWPYFSKSDVNEIFYFELINWLLLSVEYFFKNTPTEVFENILYMNSFLEEEGGTLPFTKVHVEILPQIPLCIYPEYFYTDDFKIKYNMVINYASEWELKNIFESISCIFKNLLT